MRINPVRSVRLAALATVLAAGVLIPTLAVNRAGASPHAVSLPPAHAGFDYQIGGAYTPPAGVSVVGRDHEDAPAAGLYNICYVNAFQAQEGAEGDWNSGLLLHDANGDIVYDGDWGEALLDVSTAAKRQAIADKVDGWIDDCAAKGYQAVEPDNYDSYTRSKKLLTSAEAESYITCSPITRTHRGWPSPRRTPRTWRGPHVDRARLRDRGGVRDIRRVRRRTPPPSATT